MYIDLVLVKHEGCGSRFLFQAPAFSQFDKDELVICDTKYGKQPAKVIASCTAEVGSEVYQMICAASGATMPLKKVLERVQYIELKYEEE